jgi:ABC-type transport system involved in multi-copper enzyme maturation permease subunit
VNRGLLVKSMREAAVVTAILSGALLFIEVILASILPTLWNEFSGMLLQIEFFQGIIKALLGTDIGDMLGPEAIMAIAWVHPVVLAIIWTHAIVLCTRVPAGEIDRGTIDVLFGLPVSRWRVYLSETAVLGGSGVFLIAMGLLGHRLGMLTAEWDDQPALGPMIAVTANFLCLYLAVGGLAFLVSAASDRRGRAVAIVFAILLASFLLNFLAQFWRPAEMVSFLSLLSYHKPLLVMRAADGGAGVAWPLADMAVLLGFTAVTWLAGGWWFARRDICTV